MAKILSLNANGLGTPGKLEKLFTWSKEHGADILMLQETYTVKKLEKGWNDKWNGGKIYFSHGESNQRGVATLFRGGLNVKVTKVDRDKEGRYLILQAVIDELECVICNVYRPNKDYATFFDNLWNTLNNCDTNSIIFVWGGKISM